MSSFRLCGLAANEFASLFELPDAVLAARGVLRQQATADFGFPCRVSLQDAAVGEEVLLLSYRHQPAPSPYQSAGPIFVRRGVEQCVLKPGEVPPYVSRRLISWRAYDRFDQIIDADVCEGSRIAAQLERCMGDRAVQYLHLHNARRGCFSCRVDRVE